MFDIGMTVVKDGKYAKVLDTLSDGEVLVEYFNGKERDCIGSSDLADVKVVTDSEELILDAMLTDMGTCSECCEGKERCEFEINDSNFAFVSAEVNDSIFGILSNLGIAIAEQKKLLQTAKTPLALQNAIKALAVTSANLVNAGTNMLSWMGERLSR